MFGSRGVNDSDVIVGNLFDLQENFLGNLISGQFTTIPNASPTAINNSGEVVGQIVVNGSAGDAFLYRNGVVQALGTLVPAGQTVSGANSIANGINDGGAVVGSAVLTTVGSGTVLSHAFLYDGNMHDLGSLVSGADSNKTASSAAAINDKGQIVGMSETAAFPNDQNFHAFLYSNGVMQDLGTLPGDVNSQATGIDDRGDVAGVSIAPDTGNESPFLFSNGRMIAISSLIDPALNWQLVNNAGPLINAKGEIAVAGFHPGDGVPHTLVLTLSPTIVSNAQATFTAAVASSFTVSARVRRRRR